jgi:hypothetical protein
MQMLTQPLITHATLRFYPTRENNLSTPKPLACVKQGLLKELACAGYIKDALTVITTVHDVIEGAFIFYARLPGHV